MAIQNYAGISLSPNIIIFGRQGTGRTTAAFKHLEGFEHVLYVGCAKNGLSQFDVPLEWDAILISSWDEFMSEVVDPAERGERNYEAIFIDDFDIAPEYLFPEKAKLERDDYTTIAQMVNLALNKLRSSKIMLVLTTTIIDKSDVDKSPRHALNRQAVYRMMAKFAHRWYTSIVPNKKEGRMDYCIQRKTSASSAFRDGEPDNA